jgi:cell division protein ZapA
MDKQDTKIRITVVIAGRPYSMKVSQDDEPVLRRLVKEINEKLKQFQSAYQNKDKQDLLAMSLLTYAVDLHKVRTKTVTNHSTNSDNLSDSLLEIDNLLENLLAKEKDKAPIT